MSRFLAAMAEGSRRRVETARRRRPLEEVMAGARALPPPRPPAPPDGGFLVIAEVKPRSPARGDLPARDAATLAAEYAAGGAGIVSVLTEPDAFGGSLRLLERVAAACPIPVMRKDFVVDPYQVYEARMAGADGVLLIARFLDDDPLGEAMEAVDDLGMFALLEAFDEGDIARVARCGERALLGVNCRDLDTLEAVPERHHRLASLLPAGVTAVAESAVTTPGDAGRLARAGYRGVLVGTALMEAEHPARLVAAILEAGREAKVPAR